LIRKLMEQVQTLGIADKKVIAGGVIPKKDMADLKEMGVQGIFPVGSSMEDIVKAISAMVG